MRAGRRERTLNYSCNKIAKQQLAKWKVGVKKETSGDFSQLRLIVAAGEVAEAQGERRNFVMIFSCNYVPGPVTSAVSEHSVSPLSVNRASGCWCARAALN